MTSNYLRDSSSRFEPRVVLHLVWLPAMAIESKLPYYLLGSFKFRFFPSLRSVTTEGYRIQYVLLLIHSWSIFFISELYSLTLVAKAIKPSLTWLKKKWGYNYLAADPCFLKTDGYYTICIIYICAYPVFNNVPLF